MLKPALPNDEPARLQALKTLELLDTPPEERFDRVTRLARRLFGVPIALVSIVDGERQWFKSRQGIEATETPREISFCGHAILQEGTFVVSDASADVRFFDNPLVTDDPNIRFYAGHPLSTPDGCRLGTLCLIDRTPRALSQDDLKLLQDLAAMVENEIAAIQIATLDSLTGLSNRRGFELLGEKAFSFCRRMGTPASLLFLDMDGFKAINDDFGHDEGDRALQDFARALTDTFRASDLVARLGGDEFVVFLSGAREKETEVALQRLQENVGNLGAHRSYEVRFSVGTITFDARHHDALEELVRDADKLMYENKRSKRSPRRTRSQTPLSSAALG